MKNKVVSEKTKFLAGQRFIFGFEGSRFNKDLEIMIDRYKVGGVILFRNNIESFDQVKKLCAQIQDFAKSKDLPPLFIAIDQEGGTVARLKSPWFTEFPGNPNILTDNDAKVFAQITAEEFKQVGINMNLAPVMDVIPLNFNDSVMKSRTFKGDATIVARLGVMIIKTLQENGIMAVAKHFPGIGRTVKDSHFALPILRVELNTLEAFDLLPFRAAMDVGVTGIMLSHTLYPLLDPNWQASLSPSIAHDLLRIHMAYDNLSLTDDLDMKAISHDIRICIDQIIKAGIDLTLICHKRPNIEKAVNEMKLCLDRNEEIRMNGKSSLKRIIAAKKKYLGYEAG